ncbi:1-deoxy-D-xylulose-5-phosphate reductoisomerase [Acetobacter tropicalis]|uniref:1-deoxy-D-xylulose 5-phosphate reductoisomerase n=1 Tax=Acetobacter tropicalis TaxID=104102 RepID=A0A095B9P9_9PROT|nr:1-deoxy-D-xylulose-5-phosphate reductoisomerase [Acetobacter tropicalis]KAA8389993.1 1-deoxy-D-xylulose-5-phosphate reductoisomerase [Acetobacter tropicalis]KAA8392097.1 1-deoxy-D-xylulose-5-phosphate reductoisomerase [Acetobacter tropicalis]KGB25513.1 1-deoxy-D-xylulose 5-phosphate reductoisomerase [Acetobacter tropicalis]KXV58699.1 1-deoxy-D-xylulose 5-phosphate reductoisomerase [Acetobacter tropicalis]MBC9008104.1 1-deoxy-D-xylulose-5-phosphate reductoisomerase [Acetobacter tropicalis]
MRTVTVLGSTGSIGCSTVDLLEQARDQYRVRALVGGKNATRLAEQALSLNAELAVVADEGAFEQLSALLKGSSTKVACGRQAVIDAAALPADWTMAAITGAAGLEPTLASVRNGNAVALANKEALVCAGDVMLRAVDAAGATLLPVDSEHNAVFQAMADRQLDQVEKIILTASGGPFRKASVADMEAATPAQALKHPTWSMGAKISIDSATMFNKGLEVIEAARIFGLTEDRIDVLVHPQSVVHGMVQYTDGSLIAQMGSADMRIPIAHTLAWPKRMATTSPRLDLATYATLEFSAPDEQRFPALRLAREALRAGGAASAILSAANEVAVEAFLNEQIGFLDIARVVERVMTKLGAPPADTLEAVLHWDAQARREALALTPARAA